MANTIYPMVENTNKVTNIYTALKILSPIPICHPGTTGKA
jgi:hypothetical protein